MRLHRRSCCPLPPRATTPSTCGTCQKCSRACSWPRHPRAVPLPQWSACGCTRHAGCSMTGAGGAWLGVCCLGGSFIGGKVKALRVSHAISCNRCTRARMCFVRRTCEPWQALLHSSDESAGHFCSKKARGPAMPGASGCRERHSDPCAPRKHTRSQPVLTSMRLALAAATPHTVKPAALVVTVLSWSSIGLLVGPALGSWLVQHWALGWSSIGLLVGPALGFWLVQHSA